MIGRTYYRIGSSLARQNCCFVSYDALRTWTCCTNRFPGWVLCSKREIKMAPINVDNKKRMAVLSQILRERSWRRSLQLSFINLFFRRGIILRAFLLSILLLSYDKVVTTVDSGYSHSVYSHTPDIITILLFPKFNSGLIHIYELRL